MYEAVAARRCQSSACVSSGKVRWPSGQDFTAPFVQTWKAKWIADLTGRYAFSKRLSLSAGVNKLVDPDPTKCDPGRAAPFPQLGFTHCWETCPFGMNGTSAYVKVDCTF